MSRDSGVKYLEAYRESVHSVVKPCAYCETPFETKFAMYCSVQCKNKACRDKKNENRIKDLVCFFCGGSVPKRFTKFCCANHKMLFYIEKKGNRPIKIQINPKLLIETRKYDNIPEVIARYKEQQKIK